jgi:hypothetical protein
MFAVLAAAVNANAEGPSKNKLGEARIKGMRAAIIDIEKNVLKQKEYPPIPAPVWHGNRILIVDETEEDAFEDAGREACSVAFAAESIF